MSSYLRIKTLYLGIKTLYLGIKTHYLESKTLYLESKTLYLESKTLYLESKTLYLECVFYVLPLYTILKLEFGILLLEKRVVWKVQQKNEITSSFSKRFS